MRRAIFILFCPVMAFAQGVVTTVAGTGQAGFSGDGGLATTAQLNFPGGVAVDRNSNIYIADLNNQRIRKVDPSGIISTIAGTGTPGFSGDGGLETHPESPIKGPCQPGGLW